MERPSGVLWSNHHGTAFYGTPEEAEECFYLIDCCEQAKAEKALAEKADESGT